MDDLSQEIAARAAGVELVLNEDWLQRMEDFFRRRNRVMSENNKKQAMLPTTAEILDNPIGTACGFALDIGKNAPISSGYEVSASTLIPRQR